MSDPALSIVVVFFNMRREAQRTLLSLSKRYQLGVASLDYEVIAIDNGSSEPLDDGFVRSFGPEFRYHFFQTQSKSPAEAVNFGVSQARGRQLMIMVDGAHLLTPRVLWCAATAMADFAQPFVATVSLALGAAPTAVSGRTVPPAESAVWDQAAEDRLLAGVDWQRNGYELFRVARSFNDLAMGWFGCLFESSCFAISRATFEQLGGFEQRFQSAGGGLLSLDFFRRAVSRPDLAYVVLLGEATFHQYHGGAASSAKPGGEHPWPRFHAEYQSIRGGANYQRVPRLPMYFGQFPPQALALAELSARNGFAFWRQAQAQGQQQQPQQQQQQQQPRGDV
jgi:hypothetical protein